MIPIKKWKYSVPETHTLTKHFETPERRMGTEQRLVPNA